MTRSSAPGLGSLFSARELVDVLRCSAGLRRSEAGRGSDVRVARKSKALLGRRLIFSGETERVVARISTRVGEEADDGLDVCFVCLVSGVLVAYEPIFVELRLSSTDVRGRRDLGHDSPADGMLSLLLGRLDPTEGGVRFSLLDMSTSLFLAVVLVTGCDDRSLRGTARSVYTLVVEVARFDLRDARLSGGDLDWREDLELLWLKRRVLTM
jgi:hypothetical protein